MQLLKTTLIAVISIFASVSYAATPEEEIRFLAAFKEACLKKDKEALVVLSDWAGVPPEIKKMAIDGMVHLFTDPIKSVEYGVLDPTRSLTRTVNGVTYGPNLPVTKEITIEYDLKAGNSSSTVLVGEKDGKLMVVNLVPKP